MSAGTLSFWYTLMMSPTWIFAPDTFLNEPSFLSFLKKGEDKKSNLLVFLIIKLSVFSHPLNIVKFFFNYRNYEHKCKWGYICKQKSNFERRNKLREPDQQEEKVVKHLELVEKHHGHKRDQIVLLVVLLVGRVAPGPGSSIQVDRPFFLRDDAATESPNAIASRESLGIFTFFRQ